ncbi:phosphate-starvation-inducible PsiE family protein [Methylacidiphilum caldifontis]|uniref:Phosphate-starvation-inducible E n=2 Tax=Methylacidiphilum caldifontis TaxID=2795386 RepID=A0A4Y8PGL5_9BACT|nr:phosphate-starvation-inducible PsiE family protein [Methylacidiphilum caldifontis]QSR88517.1 phosphate-starvation-inducible PsiE family protein [Methylacidiphilum caldifontis]TFE71343.1 hypothetical protein A7Q10_05070 [Methylacidiphilum caldifontis]
MQKVLLYFFRMAVAVAFNLIIFLLLVGLGVEIVRSVWELTPGLTKNATAWSFRDLVGRILSLVVILELLRAFVEYFQFDRIRLHVLLEAGAAFVLRELMLSLLDEKISGLNVLIWSLAVIVLVLGRTIALMFPPILWSTSKRSLTESPQKEQERKD